MFQEKIKFAKKIMTQKLTHTEHKKYRLVLLGKIENDVENLSNKLKNVCGHYDLQALQCAYLATLKGDVEILRGKKQQLKTVQHQLSKDGFKTKIIIS